MKLKTYKVALPLAETFTISRGSLTTQQALIVSLTDGKHTGLGEVTANTFYGHSLAEIATQVERVRDVIENHQFADPAALWQLLHPLIGHDSFAMCAIDLAAHDLFGKLQQKRLIELWGLDVTRCPYSSYTIPIDSVDGMVRRLQANPGWPCYKIKLGTPDDIAVVEAMRANTEAVLRVDANCAWTADETVSRSSRLSELGVEFIEQPLPIGAAVSDKRRVFENSLLPIIADEDCQQEADVERCRDFFHGVNVKLCKCGGLTPALRMLDKARNAGLRTMVGCMVESSIGISAAAQLLPLLDYADLDGAVLLKAEPAGGVQLRQGTVEFSSEFGTGAVLDLARLQDFQINDSVSD